jgi:hypothetical protein
MALLAWIVAHGDEQLACHVSADPVQVAEHRCDGGDDRVEFDIDQRQFLMHCPVPDGETFQRRPRGVQRF